MDAGDKTDQEIEMGGYLSDHYTSRISYNN